MSDKIYIFDEIVVEEAQSRALAERYMRDYAPDARFRGMVLESAWRSPPVEVEGRSATLHFLWSVANVGAWWAMRLGAARADPGRDVPLEGDDSKLAWWGFVDSIAISRKRTFMVDLPEAASDV